MNISLDRIVIPKPSSSIDQDTITGLADSIKELGLSHPIIVRPAKDSEGTSPNENEESKYLLVSGEKRFLAVQSLGWTEIPTEVRDIDERKGQEVRIHENLKRSNLPWHEQVVLTERLHVMRQEEHGVALKGRPSRDETEATRGWSIEDTAEELGVAIGPLSEDLSLARALRNNPQLALVKDKKTATRLIRIAADRQRNELEATLPGKLEADEVYFGDSTTILKSLPNLSIDHCITDPPWIKFFDKELTLNDRTLPVLKELFRVLKYGAMLYMFVGLDDFDYYCGHDAPNPDNPDEKIHTMGKLETIGFNVSNTPIIWQKINSLSRRGVRPWEYSRDFEFIIVACKGAATLAATRQLSGIKTHPIVHPLKMIHPNEKPVELLMDIIDDCSYIGEIIIDPFAGSGVVGDACQRRDRKYILCERDGKFYNNILKRLEKE